MARSDDLAERMVKTLWWSPALRRSHQQTGIAHVVHGGGTLCGARPYTQGASFRTPEKAGARACQRCSKIVGISHMKQVNSPEFYFDCGKRAAEARNQNDEDRASETARHFRRCRELETDEYSQEASKQYNAGYQQFRNVPPVTYFR